MLAVEGRWWAFVHVAVAAVLAASCGASAGSPGVTARPSSSAREATAPTVRPIDTATGAIEDDSGAPDPFQPPSPSCPAPAIAFTAPTMTVSTPDQIVDLVMGSSTVSTCGTTGIDDRAAADPTNPLIIRGGEMVVAVSDGWRFLWWAAVDATAHGEGMGVQAGRETPERPPSIEVPPPRRTGDSFFGVSAWVIRTDGRAVAQISGEALIRVP